MSQNLGRFIYPSVLFFLALFLVYLFLIISRKKETHVNQSLQAILLSVMIWVFGEGMLRIVPTQSQFIFWTNIRYLGTLLSPGAVFLFIAAYTNRDRQFSIRKILIIFTFALIIGLFAVTNPIHHLVWEPVSHIDPPNRTPAIVDWIYTYYSYVLFAVSTVWLVKEVLSGYRHRLHAAQTRIVIISIFSPIVANFLYLSGTTQFDYTPLVFSISAISIYIAISRLHLSDIRPLGHRLVLDMLDNGVIVVDDQNKIVDINTKSKQIFNLSEDAIGQNINRVISGDLSDETSTNTFSTLGHTHQNPGKINIPESWPSKNGTIATEIDGETHCLEIQKSKISNELGHSIGMTYLFTDVTEKIQQQRKIAAQKDIVESQNQRLEEFAAEINHDLRTPLTVVKGFADKLEEGANDGLYIKKIQENANRIEQIAENLNNMAEQRQIDPEEVKLEQICKEAWEHTNNSKATIQMEIDPTTIITADKSDLLRVFENLFKNSIQHVRDDVTIRVAETSNGIVIEDDGNGIPKSKRDKIFDRGYTTSSDGSGFGLPIVKQTVEMHGWEIEIFKGKLGGAAFEIAFY